MKVGDKDCLQLKGWMINDLGLKGNELIVYALIYEFSRATGLGFFGSVEYMMAWTNTSKKTIYNVLDSLLEKGLIIKGEAEYLGREHSYYGVVNKEV